VQHAHWSQQSFLQFKVCKCPDLGTTFFIDFRKVCTQCAPWAQWPWVQGRWLHGRHFGHTSGMLRAHFLEVYRKGVALDIYNMQFIFFSHSGLEKAQTVCSPSYADMRPFPLYWCRRSVHALSINVEFACARRHLYGNCVSFAR